MRMSTVLCFVYFLSYLSLHTETNGSCGSCSKVLSAHYNKDSPSFNHALCGFVFETLKVVSYAECFTACVERNCRCMSFNLNQVADPRGERECELNYQDMKNVPSALKSRPGFGYYQISAGEIDNKCSDKTCINNCCKHNPCHQQARCTELCHDVERFNCSCPSGFFGRLCEKKGLIALTESVTQHFLNHSITWDISHAFCQGLGERLCHSSEICPDSKMPLTGVKQGDHWVPMSDRVNDWIQIGDYPHKPCKQHFATMGYPGSWSTTTRKVGLKGTVLCCQDFKC